MQKLSKIARKSEIMDISINYGGKEIKFNLYEELRINIANVNNNITKQSQLHGFLGLVVSKLAIALERAEARKERIWETIYQANKKKRGVGTNRLQSDDLCKSKATTHKKYQEALKEYIRIKGEFKTVSHILDSFKQRKDLLQTFSSNNRNSS